MIAEQVTRESVLALASKLADYSWTLCTGFRLGSYVFLNDSFTESSAQEWAVFEADPNEDESHSQVESVTISWMTPDQAASFLLNLYGLQPPPPPAPGPVVVAASVGMLREALGAPHLITERGYLGDNRIARHHLRSHPAGTCHWCA